MNEINDKSFLSEIFSAIQGEGYLVGVRQIFVRFSACDLRCKWCDTPDSLVRTKHCEVEEEPGIRKFYKIINPIEKTQLLNILKKLNPSFHHSISLTGGEPLLQWKFLSAFLPVVKEQFALPIYLESGGHRPGELNKIIHLVDYVSMDFKLPTSANAGTLWDEHLKFLNISLEANKKTWVKIVVTAKTSFDDLLTSIDILKSVKFAHEPVDVFLQPVTSINEIIPPNEIELLSLQKRLIKHYPKIRVLPQVHKLIGQK
ncbi:MAG: 7-carboxy-7-deazaguanine synthase QueE [Candidatus Melainabacteria bacterium]|nr:7-carboxy-7-deazaguanine synthase QueE [Candidatus Melainabacteria bacterium]